MCIFFPLSKFCPESESPIRSFTQTFWDRDRNDPDPDRRSQIRDRDRIDLRSRYRDRDRDRFGGSRSKWDEIPYGWSYQKSDTTFTIKTFWVIHFLFYDIFPKTTLRPSKRPMKIFALFFWGSRSGSKLGSRSWSNGLGIGSRSDRFKNLNWSKIGIEWP